MTQRWKKERHPIFDILETIAGMGWTFANGITVFDLGYEGRQHLFRVETDHESARFACTSKGCEVTSGPLEWTKAVARTPLAGEADVMRMFALIKAFESYRMVVRSLPSPLGFDIVWNEQRGVYGVGISPDPGPLSGFEVWGYELEPTFEITSAGYSDH